MGRFAGRVKWVSDRRSAVLATVRAAEMVALADAGEHILETANRTVPLEEGTLQRSGQVTTDDRKRVAVISYDTPYAVRQHEDTRNRHNSGRRAKWLELTMQEEQGAVRDMLADRMRRAF